MNTRLSRLSGYPLASAAAVLLVGSFVAIAAGLDYRLGMGPGIALLRLAVGAGAALALVALVVSTNQVLRGRGAPRAVLLSAVIFVIALGLTFAVFLPDANPSTLINYPNR